MNGSTDRPSSSRWNEYMKQNGLYLAFMVALISTLGSLYYSELREFIPCEYCWYQRILMYPLVLWFAIAAVRKDLGVIMYTLPLSMLGMGFSMYHYLTQKVAFFHERAGACAGLIKCNEAYVNYFGFVTIPFLAFIGFTLITLVLLLTYRAAKTGQV
ncbi:disulfide oxidoreductase [Marinicrinis sediminis]|uniref:Disulfide oxidoreductase n=1 Tax=Marinicrinis sediminis TaxID=1652465 RepID=A0ABW5R7T8_9BACL